MKEGQKERERENEIQSELILSFIYTIHVRLWHTNGDDAGFDRPSCNIRDESIKFDRKTKKKTEYSLSFVLINKNGVVPFIRDRVVALILRIMLIIGCATLESRLHECAVASFFRSFTESCLGCQFDSSVRRFILATTVTLNIWKKKSTMRLPTIVS